ncbi:MAG: hypothetical protein QW788_04385 [Candidatus Hadarchaeales archaeon]
MEEYFFIAVSNKENLELCLEWAMAGFPDTINGVWAYCDIKPGDFLTFLYGAKAYNLYRVIRKEAVKNPQVLPPPWKPIFFQTSGKVCHFPFRLELEPLRRLEEPLIRHEFSYIAENLLQRGGYWKTHFQADQTTLQQVSGMGEVWREEVRRREGISPDLFEPRFVRSRKKVEGAYPLREVIVQSVLRHHLLRREVLKKLLNLLGVEGVGELEVLGEKALSEGYVDIFIKESYPKGKKVMIAIEVKLGSAERSDIEQLERYVEELGEECKAGVLLAERVPKHVSPPERIHLIPYSFAIDLSSPHTFEELLKGVKLEL